MGRSGFHCAIVIVAVALGGCSREPASDADGATGAATTSPATSSVPTSGPAAATEAVAAVALGGDSLPVRIGFELEAMPVVGQKSRISIEVTAAEQLQRLQIDVRSAALAVEPGSATILLDALQPGQPVRRDIELTAQAAGLAELELQVTAVTAAGERRAGYAIPVLASAAAPASAGP